MHSSLQSKGFTPDKVVPLSLHVDYWDYIGWKNPHAKRVFATRQRRLAELKRAKMIYTSQVILQGQDFERSAAALRRRRFCAEPRYR